MNYNFSKNKNIFVRFNQYEQQIKTQSYLKILFYKNGKIFIKFASIYLEENAVKCQKPKIKFHTSKF